MIHTQAKIEAGEQETWDAPAIRALTNRIIERCAQVAFKHMTEMDGEATPEGTAAAIRALKEKP